MATIITADIASTLDEYAALLDRTEMHLLEGELHELRARVADRANEPEGSAAALRLAHEGYVRFGMTAHADRLAAELPG